MPANATSAAALVSPAIRPLLTASMTSSLALRDTAASVAQTDDSPKRRPAIHATAASISTVARNTAFSCRLLLLDAGSTNGTIHQYCSGSADSGYPPLRNGFHATK